MKITQHMARLAVLGLAAPGAVVLTAASAGAATDGTSYTDADIGPIVATNDAAQAALTPENDGSKSSSTFIIKRPTSVSTTQEQTDAALGLNHNRTLSSTNDITRTPPGGRAGTFRARGYSYVKVPFLEVSSTYINNQAHTWWLGTSPINASSVLMSETWSNSGVAISLSFPLGAGFSGTGASTTDTTSVSRNWQVHSYVDTVRFGAIDIYRVRHTVAGKFQFGTTAFTVTTTDSSLV